MPKVELSTVTDTEILAILKLKKKQKQYNNNGLNRNYMGKDMK